MQARLLTPDETAELLGIARGTLTMWRATRRVILPYVKVGSHVRYKPEDVQKFVESRTVTGTAEAR
jgi:excisionase family DNA binding protein